MKIVLGNSICFHCTTAHQFHTSCIAGRVSPLCPETFIPILGTGKMLRNKMQGLTWASLKKNTMLIPLFFCVGVGATGATLYLIRLALRSPDVTWYGKKNPEPWNEYKDKRYKFLSPYGKTEVKSTAPEY